MGRFKSAFESPQLENYQLNVEEGTKNGTKQNDGGYQYHDTYEATFHKDHTSREGLNLYY